jgi:hypothetical protein
VDPNAFTTQDIKKLIEDAKFQMKSGVPIKRVVLRRTITEPIVIPRKTWNAQANRYVPDADPRTVRVYIGGNNHHIEIREDVKSGKWSGEVIDMFTAAQRLRPPKKSDGSREKPEAPVDRSDRDGKRFVMSLAEGETIYMRHPDTGQLGYFVVFKLDKGAARIWLTHHWDARPAKMQKDQTGNEKPDSRREEIDVVAGNLKALGAEPGKPPYKVRISPLGEVTPLHRD